MAQIHTLEHQFDLAEHALKEARNLLRAKWYMNSVSNSYQAVLRGAAGLIYGLGVRPQTEREVRIAFSAQFVAPGKSSAKFADAFRELERMRHKTDFDIDAEGTEEEAQKALALAEDFMAEARRLRSG